MLVQWEWGVKEAMQEDAIVKFLLLRKPTKKEVCELKYEIVKSLLENEALRAFIPPPVLVQLKAYYAAGVYGEKAPIQYNPEYATENA